jgi:hypothetical protein
MPDLTYVPFFFQHDPPGREPGLCWVAELREETGMATVPVAVAYLTDCRCPHPELSLGVSLDFIWVPDHCRRSGYATRLIRACEERWPDLVLTDPISRSGAALLRSLERAEPRASPPG